MVDEPITGTTGDDPKQDKPSGLPSLSSAPGPTSQSNTSYADQIRKYRENVVRLFVAIWAFLDRHNGGITAVATVAIVALTFVYVKYSKRQWKVMSDTLIEAKRSSIASGQQTSDLIEAARIQASASRRIQVAAGRQARAASSFSKSAATLATAAQKAAKATARLATDNETANDETKKAVEINSRPWIGIEGFPSNISVGQNGDGINFTIRLINYGASPAVAVSNQPQFKLVHGRVVQDGTFEDNGVCPQQGKGKMFMENGLRHLTSIDFVAPGINGIVPQDVFAPATERLNRSNFLIGCTPYLGPSNVVYYTRVGYSLTVSVSPDGHSSFTITGREFYAFH